MAELKLTNNPCKFCNGEIDEGKPLCGDLVDLGDVCCMVKGLTGFQNEELKPDSDADLLGAIIEGFIACVT